MSDWNLIPIIASPIAALAGIYSAIRLYRNRVLLRLAVTAPAGHPPVIRLILRNAGTQSTVLVRGWTRWGPGDNEVTWDVPVGGVAVPGGGLLRNRIGPVAPIPAIEVATVFDYSRGNEPLVFGVQDVAGNTVEAPAPEELRALFQPGSSVPVP